MSKPRPHENQYFASVPLVLTFANEVALKYDANVRTGTLGALTRRQALT
jgi:hypothetical protein